MDSSKSIEENLDSIDGSDLTLPGVVSSGQLSGELGYVSDFGRITGWALNQSQLNLKAQIEFYIDGPKSSGIPITGSVVANSYGSGIKNGHSFVFEVPSEYKTGNVHYLFAYAILGADQLLLAEAIPFAAYAPSNKGQVYFDTNLKAKLQSSCSSCHGVQYTNQFYSLINPTPFKGGTATANELINKATGRGHGGGTRCATINSSPCLEMQEWWRLEFL